MFYGERPTSVFFQKTSNSNSVRVPNENSFPMISFEKFGPSHF